MVGNKKAILRTLIYSDIFDYPLKEEEIWKYYLGTIQVSLNGVTATLQKQITGIVKVQKFYCLRGRESLAELRLEREKISAEKEKRARNTIALLSIIPTIDLIGISGSLAMQNAKREDDIDLFVITNIGTVWMSRLYIVVILSLFRLRRKRTAECANDAVCVNFIIDSSVMELPKDRQNLYTAHEIMQMRPLFNRHETYEKFLFANKWLVSFLPNCTLESTIMNHELGQNKKHIPEQIGDVVRIVLEFLARKFQLWYMREHKTTETVTNAMAAFHPKDARAWIMRSYHERLEKYHV